MRLIPLTSIEVGTVLAVDIFGAEATHTPLLRRGVALSAQRIQGLVDRGFSSVWIEDELGEGVIPPPPVVEPETRKRVSETVRLVAAAAERARAGGERVFSEKLMEQVRSAALLMAGEIERSPQASVALGSLAEADAYTHSHSMRVTELGLKMAAKQWHTHGYVDYRGRISMERIDRRLARFGTGLLLHDVGKLLVDPAIINKPGRLTSEEYAAVQEHPTFGWDMLRTAEISEVAKSVIRSHHERPDGRGYPDGLSGDKINEFVGYAAVADVYDAIASDRPYQAARPPWEALQIIRDGAGSAFTQAAVDALCAVVLPYPVGITVDVDGQEAVVIDADFDDPYRPTVRMRVDDRLLERRVDFAARDEVLAA